MGLAREIELQTTNGERKFILIVQLATLLEKKGKRGEEEAKRRRRKGRKNMKRSPRRRAER
jgi:hypothetical protein